MNYRQVTFSCFLVILSVGLSSAATWDDDFEDLNQGDLVGQASWDDYNPDEGVTAVSPIVGYSADSRVRGLVVSQPESEGKFISRGWKRIAPICRSGDTISLEFDAQVTHDRGVATFGLGRHKVYPSTFGIFFNRFALREETYGGRIHYVQDEDGQYVLPNPGDWYRIRSFWKRDKRTGEWSGSLEVRNLSENERFYTQLYFDRKQTVDRVSLGYSADILESDLEVVTLRTQQPGDEIDNLLIDSTR